MKSLSARVVALVVAGVMVLPTPLEASVASPSTPEGEPPAASEGEGASEPKAAEPHEDGKEARVAEASRHYRDGQALFDEQQYAAAAEAFERSHAAIATPNTLYNIAVSHELAEEPIPSILAYERYLGTGAVPAEERAEVDAAIIRLRAKVGEFELPEEVEVAEVRVNGETIEEFPHLVMPGPVTVEVVGTKEGQRLERTYDMRPGDRRTIDVSFPQPEPAPAPVPLVEEEPPKPPPVDREAERRRQRLKKVFWGGVGVTAASGAAIGVLGGLERYWESEFEANKCPNPCPPDEENPDNPSIPYPQEQKDRYEAYQIATNVMIGVTSAFAITTLVLGLRAYRKGSRSGRRARTPSVRLVGSNLVVRW
jgi:hypothetical protein